MYSCRRVPARGIFLGWGPWHNSLLASFAGRSCQNSVLNSRHPFVKGVWGYNSWSIWRYKKTIWMWVQTEWGYKLRSYVWQKEQGLLQLGKCCSPVPRCLKYSQEHPVQALQCPGLGCVLFWFLPQNAPFPEAFFWSPQNAFLLEDLTAGVPLLPSHRGKPRLQEPTGNEIFHSHWIRFCSTGW